MASITTEGRRVYIQTSYGEACVEPLKDLGVHWDREKRQWWIGSGKRAEVEAIVAKYVSPAGSGQERKPEDPDEVAVIGKARYKDRSYYVRWEGVTKKGDHKFRLTTLDAKIDFWADGALCRWEKTYEEERTLGSIRRFIERKKKEGESRSAEGNFGGGEDWRYNKDGAPGPVRGCGQCRLLGEMCKSCRFDEFDN